MMNEEITRLRRIIRAWEDGHLVVGWNDTDKKIFKQWVVGIGWMYYDTPAEAYAALEDDDD